MKNYTKQFNSSLIWYTISSLLAQGFLILHHILLRNMSSSQFHGLFGCSLSLFYFLLALFNLGLNSVLISFFQQFSASRKNLKTLILKHFIPQTIFLILTSIPIAKFITTYFLASEDQNLIISLTLTIAFCFFMESIRILLSYFLKLAFYYRVTSILEILGMILYLTYVYLVAHSISIYYLWIGHLISSTFQAAILTIAFIRFYYSLPLNSKTINSPTLLRVWKTRLFTATTQISSQLFSGNFLVPICAYFISLDAASLLKILSSSTRWINIIFQKIFGVSAGAIFAHIKNYSIHEKSKIFNKINNNLIYIIITLIIFIIINHRNFAYNSNSMFNSINNSLVASLVILFILENFFILYEKWFILEEKAYYLFFANFLNLILAVVALACLNINSLAGLLLVILVTRIITFILLSILAYFKWQIKPSFTLNYKAIILLITSSLLFYFLVNYI